MRRRHIAVAAILAGFIVGSLALELQLRDPSYGGRKLSAWLAHLDLESSHSSQQAVYAIQAISTNALPMLASMIGSTDPWWKRSALSMNARQSFLRIPVTPASVFRNRAVQGYTALGPRAKEAVPELILLLETESSAQVRSSVAAALGGIGPEAKAAIPALVKATQDQSSEVRKESFWALANIQRWSLDLLPLHFER